MQIYIFMGSVRFILSAKHYKKNLLYVAYFMSKITKRKYRKIIYLLVAIVFSLKNKLK